MSALQEIAFKKACSNATEALQILSRELRYIICEMPTEDIITLIKEMPERDRERLYMDSLQNEDYEICAAFSELLNRIK